MKIKFPELYETSLNSITPVPCQNFIVKYYGEIFLIHLDSGATVSFIKHDLIVRLKIRIKPNGQLAMLADEKTRMQSLGEIDVLVTVEDKIVLRLRALVVKHLHVQVYAGTTFHVDNKVEANIATGDIEFHGGTFKIKQHNLPALGLPVAHPPPAITLNELARHNVVISEQSATVSSLNISPLTVEDLADQIKLLRSEVRGNNAQDQIVSIP